MFGKAKAWLDRKGEERAERKWLESPAGRARAAWEAGQDTFTFSDRTGKSDPSNHTIGLDEPHVVIPTDPAVLQSVRDEGWALVETKTNWVSAVFSSVNVGTPEQPDYQQRQTISGYHQHHHTFRRTEQRVEPTG